MYEKELKKAHKALALSESRVEQLEDMLRSKVRT